MILIKGIVSLLGAGLYLGIFWCACHWCQWDAPTWAWFIVGWMGYDDAYGYLTYARND